MCCMPHVCGAHPVIVAERYSGLECVGVRWNALGCVEVCWGVLKSVGVC